MKRKGLIAAVAAVVVIAAVFSGTFYAWSLGYFHTVNYGWYRSDGDMVMDPTAGNLQALSNLVNGDYDPDEVAADVAEATDGAVTVELDGEPLDFTGQTITATGGGGHFSFFVNDYYTMTPIGCDADHAFNGTFDGDDGGKNKTVNYLFFDNTDADAEGHYHYGTEYIGLFGHVGPDGCIKNLTTNDTCSIKLVASGTDDHIAYVGGLVGYCEGSVENLTSYTQIEVSYDDGNAGEERSVANARVVDGVGGIAGYADGDVTGCVNKGRIEVSTTADSFWVEREQGNMVYVVRYVGGITGRSGGNPLGAARTSQVYGALSGCTNSADITVVTSGMGGTDRFGETVESKSEYVGGIAGYAVGDVLTCENSASVIASSYREDPTLSDEENQEGFEAAAGGGSCVGGIVGGYRNEGYGSGHDSSVYATEEEKEEARQAYTDSSGRSVDRGIVGKQLNGDVAQTVNAKECTNLGYVLACDNVGGIMGATGTYTVVTGCINGDAKKVLADEDCAAVTSTRWNKPHTGGIVGMCYGNITYSRNHAEISNSKDGYYVGGIGGALYFYTDYRSVNPEVYACYSTGQLVCDSSLRRGAILGGCSGYLHDCLYLYGTATASTDEEVAAIGYMGTGGETGTYARVSVAFASDEDAQHYDEENETSGSFSLKSSTAIAWLNKYAQNTGWDEYWMLNANENRGYPVLKHEGYDPSGVIDISALNPSITLYRDAQYSASINPTPTLLVTVTIGNQTIELVENADYYVQPDPEAAAENGSGCKGVTNGERPYIAQICGFGSYTGQTGSVAYGITKGDFSTCTALVTSATYTGKALSPQSITVCDEAGYTVAADAYETPLVNNGEDCVEPGSYTVSIDAADESNYTGRVIGAFEISRVDISSDCDVVGLTYEDAKRGWRTWFFDDELSKVYEVKPTLKNGELTYYTLEDLQELKDSGNWDVEDDELEGYVGYPQVSGFRLYHEDGDLDGDGIPDGRLLSTADPYDEYGQGDKNVGMSLDYTGEDLRPRIIGLNWSQGKVPDDWWNVVYGSGIGMILGSITGSDNHDGTANGHNGNLLNIEASTTGAVSVTYSDRDGSYYLNNYDVLHFGINQVQLNPEDLHIVWHYSTLPYNGGKAPSLAPEATITYNGVEVADSNYRIAVDYEIDANGNRRSANQLTYNEGDEIHYKIQFVSGGSIICEDIADDSYFCVIVEDQYSMDDVDIYLGDFLAEDGGSGYVGTYTLAGVEQPGVRVYDPVRSRELVLGRDYTLSYEYFWLPDGSYGKNSAPNPWVTVSGIGAYAGSKKINYSVNRGVLTEQDIQSIYDGRVENAKLASNSTSDGVAGGGDLEKSNLYFPYRVNGYAKEDLWRGIALCWHPDIVDQYKYPDESRNPNTAPEWFREQGLFNVAKIVDSSGAEVDRLTEPDKYTLTIVPSAEGPVKTSDYGNDMVGFDLADDFEELDISVTVNPANLTDSSSYTDEETAVTTSITQYRLWSARLSATTWRGSLSNKYPYTGNMVVPVYMIYDSTYNDYTYRPDYCFDTGDFYPVTEGYEDLIGPTEPGKYQAAKVVANAEAGHLCGSYDVASNSQLAYDNTYTIYAANLNDDVDIEVDTGYYTGDTGATPAVHFYVGDEECSYVEGSDYSLEYSDNTEPGTGHVRIRVLDQNHLAANDREDDGTPYVDVDFVMGGRTIALDTDADWEYSEQILLDDVDKGTLVEPWTEATFEEEDDAHTIITVPDDAYTIACGTYDEATDVFIAQDSGWQAGDTVYYAVTSTGKYERYRTSDSTSRIIGHAEVVEADENNSFENANTAASDLKIVFADTGTTEDSVTYTGTGVTPDVAVYAGSEQLTEKKDYTLSYADNVDVTDTAAVTVKGKGGYHGSCTLNFSITPASLSDCTLEVDTQEYTGSQIAPEKSEMHLMLSDVTLPEEDWDITGFGENIEAGEDAASVTLKAGDSGNLTGSGTFTFDIASIALDESRLKISTVSQDYTGEAISMEDHVTVVDTRGTEDEGDDITLVFGKDYTLGYPDDQVSAGTKRLYISGTGNYTGTIETSYSIYVADISRATVTVDQGTEDAEGNIGWSYTGSAIEPDVTVTTPAGIVLPDDDYDVTYSNNVDAGLASVTVTGTENCTGTAPTATFTILGVLVSKANADLYQKSNTYAYTGAGIEPDVILRIKGNKVDAKNYDLTYATAEGEELDAAPIDCGTYTVGIVSKTSNLTVSSTSPVTATFTIVQAGISTCSITIDAPYNFGEMPEASITLKSTAGVVVDEGYYTWELSYADTSTYALESAVTAYIWASEDEDCPFVGSTVAGGAISRIPISADDVTFLDGEGDDHNEYDYTGSEITPQFSVTVDGRDLTQGVDYNAVYLGDKTTPGAQTIEIGCPPASVYESTTTVNYYILGIPITADDVAFLDGEGDAHNEYIWTGSEITPQIAVVVDNKTLAEGSDYELVFLDDKVSPGEQRIRIDCPTGSVYTSTVTVSYYIVKEEEPEPEPTPEPTPTPDPDTGNPGTSTPGGTGSGTGSTVTVGGCTYTLSSSGATLTKVAAATKSVNVANVTSGGKTYQVTSVAANAAAGCKKLTKVVLGPKVKKVGKGAFSGCTALKIFKAKCKKLAKLNAKTFKGDKKLRKVTLKSTKLKKISTSCFKGCTKVKMKVPKKQKAKVKKLVKKAKAGKSVKVR